MGVSLSFFLFFIGENSFFSYKTYTKVILRFILICAPVEDPVGGGGGGGGVQVYASQLSHVFRPLSISFWIRNCSLSVCQTWIRS